jgi:hypothetical protein
VYPAANGSVTAIITINRDEAITSTTASAVGQSSSYCTVVSGYCTISGLEYGREYRFSAVSTNSAGEGAATIAGPITLEAPPVAPASAVAVLGSTSTSVVFSNPPFEADEVIASVVGDASKSCTWSSRAGGARLCAINGLTSPGSLTYQVVSRSYRLGQSSARTATNTTAPNVVTVSGFTSGDSPTASASMSIASSPVLRGLAAKPSIPGTDNDVVLNWTPTGTPSWFTGTPGSVAHSVTAAVAADGTWSYTLPANFPEGTSALDFFPMHVYQSGQQPEYGDPFFHTFGRASRATVSAGETKREPTLSQALHLAVGDSVRDRLSSGGVIKKLIETKSTPEDIIDELFVRSLARRPTSKEMTAMRELVGEDVKNQAVYEDILWSLLNSTEFLFNY